MSHQPPIYWQILLVFPNQNHNRNSIQIHVATLWILVYNFEKLFSWFDISNVIKGKFYLPKYIFVKIMKKKIIHSLYNSFIHFSMLIKTETSTPLLEDFALFYLTIYLTWLIRIVIIYIRCITKIVERTLSNRYSLLNMVPNGEHIIVYCLCFILDKPFYLYG